jgi:hypothetical protein
VPTFLPIEKEKIIEIIIRIVVLAWRIVENLEKVRFMQGIRPQRFPPDVDG